MNIFIDGNKNTQHITAYKRLRHLDEGMAKTRNLLFQILIIRSNNSDSPGIKVTILISWIREQIPNISFH